MNINENVTESFVNDIVDVVSKMIAAHDHMSVEEASEKFKASKVYDYLCHPAEPFLEEGPDHFYEMYENLTRTGEMLDDTDMYLKKHPELYKVPK